MFTWGPHAANGGNRHNLLAAGSCRSTAQPSNMRSCRELEQPRQHDFAIVCRGQQRLAVILLVATVLLASTDNEGVLLLLALFCPRL